jgi:hypothetical protein
MRITTRTLAGLALWAGLAGGQAVAQVKTEDVLARKPVQPNVQVSTPVGAELAGCRAEAVTWPKPATGPAPTGVVVKDAQGRTVRQFIDTTGSGDPRKANIWSFYLNGVEAYREVDGNGNGKPDQYRWLGPNGGKWGIDIDEDGQVDTWHMISPEELSQELFEAILTRNAKKVEALLPSDQDLKSVGIPDAEIAKIRQKAAGAVKRMMETADALKLSDKAKWVHLELETPAVTPADAFGGREDLVRHRTATVLVDRGDGKSADVFQTGELILIGRAWKLVEGPTPGAAQPAPPAGAGEVAGEVVIPPGTQDILAQLNKLTPPANPADLLKYHKERAALLEQIVAKAQGAQQEPWLRQVIDAYTSAAESGDTEAMQRLRQWQEQIEKAAPKSPAAPYAAFRVASAEYAVKLAEAKTQDDMLRVQSWWRGQLEGFVTKYPAAEDAPEAMNRLAVSFEYVKDGEAQAKTWYERLARDFATHPYGAKAQGAVRRLTSEGQPFALVGQTLDGKAFNSTQLAGKAVIVYYWASWGRDAVNELKALGELAKTYGPKGLELVTVSLDDDPAKAVQALNAAQAPGTHLHAPGGLDRSPLAVAYGIQMVPHVFLVGKDGKVSDRNAQTGPTLKDQVEKLVK